MKFCVSSYQPDSIRRQADEIRIRYPHREHIMELIEEYPEKTFIFEATGENINWELLQAYSDKVDFHICIKDFSYIPKCKEYNLKFFWGFPITTFAELASMAINKPSFVYIGEPLCFQLEQVARYNIPIRLCPNIANYFPELTNLNSLCGPWIRPEDLKYYEPYVSSIDFVTDTVPKEAILFKVYGIDKKWPDDLNILITNLNRRIINSALPDEFGERRVNCGQKCFAGKKCNHCAIMARTAELVE